MMVSRRRGRGWGGRGGEGRLHPLRAIRPFPAAVVVAAATATATDTVAVATATMSVVVTPGTRGIPSSWLHFVNVLIQREKVNTKLVTHWLARPVQAIRGL